MAVRRMPRTKSSKVPTDKKTPATSKAVREVDYQGVFEDAPLATLIADAQGRYLQANRAACELTRYPVGAIQKKQIGQLVATAQDDSVRRYIQELRANGRATFVGLLVRKDESQFNAEVQGVVLPGGIILETLRDVTELRADENALQADRHAYGALVDICNDAVISAGPDGRITSWNPAAEALFGYSAAEARGMPVIRLIPPRLHDRHLAGFSRHVTLGAEVRFGRSLTTVGLRRDGSEVPLEISLGVGRHGTSQVFTAVARDITEQCRVVERLNDALQRLQFHVERMPLAYIVWDTGFRVVEWNPAAERIFGYSKEEAMGRHAYDLVVPPDVRPAVDVIWADLLEGDTSSHSINDNCRKDGSRVTCEWFNTPLRDSKGRIHGVASMAMDVSEREQMEAQLRNTQKLESLGVLASGIAHDFNSSLMVILGNAALLRSARSLPPRAIEHLDMIEEAGSRAHELVKHLLAYARTGRHNPEPADFNIVIQDALAFVRSSIGKQHELALELAGDLPLIPVDRSQVEQVVLNLCMNAKQAMPRGGTIRITTRRTRLTQSQLARCVPCESRPGEYVEMAVSDTGCGMDEATVARIFDPFFTTKPEGHGLGLAAVLGILRQHHGVACVESKPNQGTRISIFFPVSRA